MGHKPLNAEWHTITIMTVTLPEFKNRLASYMASTEYDETTDLLSDWDGYSAITIDKVNEYNCSLERVTRILDEIGIDSELRGFGCYGGMYISICVVFP